MPHFFLANSMTSFTQSLIALDSQTDNKICLTILLVHTHQLDEPVF